MSYLFLVSQATVLQKCPQREPVLEDPAPVDSPQEVFLSGLQAAAVNVAELFHPDLPGRFEALPSRQGREQRQARRWILGLLQAFPVLQDILRPL